MARERRSLHKLIPLRRAGSRAGGYRGSSRKPEKSEWRRDGAWGKVLLAHREDETKGRRLSPAAGMRF